MSAQRIEIELPLEDEKGRSKAMRKASEINGVTRVEIIRERKLLVVSGAGVDCVELAKSLRKIFGYARVVSVRPIASDQSIRAETAGLRDYDFLPQPQPTFSYNYPTPTHYYYQLPYPAKPVQDLDPPICSIM